MTKLLDIQATQKFLEQVVRDEKITLAFVCNMEGGMICSSNPAQDRMAIDALAAIWPTLLPANWTKMYFEWETAYIVLVNCGSCVFGLEWKDHDSSETGYLNQKAEACAENIKKQLNP